MGTSRRATIYLDPELHRALRVKAAETSLLNTNGAFRVALNALAELMGLRDVTLENKTEIAPLTAEAPEELQAADAESMIAYAAENRPDVALARAATDRAGAFTKVQRASFSRVSMPSRPTTRPGATSDSARTGFRPR